MTDQQLIDATAAAIAEELFLGGNYAGVRMDAAWLDQRAAAGARLKTFDQSDVSRIVARHLAAMLAQREETGLPPECIYTAQQVRDLADGLRERGWEPE